MEFNINSLPPLKIVYLVMLTGLLVSLSACLSADNIRLQAFPTSIPSRTVSYATTSAQEKWRISNLIVPYRDTSNIYANGDSLYFVAYSDDGITHWVEVYDARTGEVRWKSDYLPFSENSLASDEQRLYVALLGQILAYNIQTGQLLWTQELPYGHTRYQVYLLVDTLLVYSEEDSINHRELVIRSYNLQTGSLENIDRTDIPHNNSHLLRTTLSDYWTNGKSIWSVSRQTKQVNWSLGLANRVEYEPVLTDANFVFCSGIFSDVMSLKDDTGSLAWQYEGKAVSNLSANSGIVYLIKDDATLIGIDANTGREVYRVEVLPQFTENETRSISYLVAANDTSIYVYYGDSHELFAFSE